MSPLFNNAFKPSITEDSLFFTLSITVSIETSSWCASATLFLANKDSVLM